MKTPYFIIKSMAWQTYVFCICHFSKTFLHPLWHFKKEQSLRIRPVIMTCGKNLELFETFVASYKKNVRGFQQPLVFIDTFGQPASKRYLELVSRLDPYKIIPIEKIKKNRKENIWFFALHGLFKTALPHVNDAMLFMEDDIIFSSQFTFVAKRLQFKKNTGLITLYSPYHEYLPIKTDGILHTIHPKVFYGNQAIVLPKKVIKTMAQQGKKMESFPPMYDHQWAGLLEEMRYQILATNNSYVQHIGHVSRLRKDLKTHESYKFIP